ncbi:Beta-1 adrenergic receptor [Clarias magur]|uniref:Beta-1 adrenergic receptor n=1 Tax=Clarias magur TaxID=1594786 RepID=A0A8J4WPF3_CLAMG|nr:Beta-1 adrenergic receptor [Clarias magur]
MTIVDRIRGGPENPLPENLHCGGLPAAPSTSFSSTSGGPAHSPSEEDSPRAPHH